MKIKALYDVPTKARLYNLLFRPPKLQHLNIAKMLLKAYTIYN
jgi:hypothetical protein